MATVSHLTNLMQMARKNRHVEVARTSMEAVALTRCGIVAAERLQLVLAA